MKYLTPDDLKDIPVFNEWEAPTETQLPDNTKIKVLEGTIPHTGCNGSSSFAMLPSIVSKDEVSSILGLVKQMEFKTDPDSVDGMCTHEMYIDLKNNTETTETTPNEPQTIKTKLEAITTSIINTRLTAYVRSRYPQLKDRVCTPSHTLIRRYRDGERRLHITHRDGHAYATMVISLSNYGEEYRGGIYVASAERYKKVVALNRGDAVIHKFDLLHGVKVKDDGGERWSWIIWFKDSPTCANHSSEWYKKEAHNGLAVYQSLYANVVSEKDRVMWLKKAAEQGHANSMVKLARANLKMLSSQYFEFNPQEAYRLYRKAIESSQEPDAQYEIVQLILQGFNKQPNIKMSVILHETIDLLQQAAQGGHLYAMFNLGIAHLYGYTGERNIELATKWFKASQIPEGLVATSMYYNSIGDTETANKLKESAEKLGYGTTWRKQMRIQTGLGGASGVDINLPWPTMPNGLKPDKW
jgi:TPR repeat protein